MVGRRAIAGALASAFFLAEPAATQQSPSSNPNQQGASSTENQHPGRTVLLSKCFQCHTDATWRDQRQERTAWEAALYRMVGRGALWTSEEIRLMADFLGTGFGPSAGSSSSSSSPAAPTSTANPPGSPTRENPR
jgi:hypothetical protein